MNGYIHHYNNMLYLLCHELICSTKCYNNTHNNMQNVSLYMLYLILFCDAIFIAKMRCYIYNYSGMIYVWYIIYMYAIFIIIMTCIYHYIGMLYFIIVYWLSVFVLIMTRHAIFVIIMKYVYYNLHAIFIIIIN